MACTRKDTDNLHIHLVANRIGLDGEVYETTFISNRSARAAEEISRQMGLTIANEVHKLKQHRAEHTDSTRQAVKEQLQRIAYGESGKGHHDIKDFLAVLRQQGVRIDPKEIKQGRIYGLRFGYAGQTFKASEICRDLGYRSLLNQFGITARGQKSTSKVLQYPMQRQEQKRPELRQQPEREQSSSLCASLIEGAANAVGGMMMPAHNDYDPMPEWYEMLDRKRKHVESHDNKPYGKHGQREEIGELLLVGSVIGEIDRLDAIGEQAGRTAKTYRQILDDLKGYKLQVDTDARYAREKAFAAALEKQIKHPGRNTDDTFRPMAVNFMLFLCFAVGYCYLEARPWKAKF